MAPKRESKGKAKKKSGGGKSTATRGKGSKAKAPAKSSAKSSAKSTARTKAAKPKATAASKAKPKPASRQAAPGQAAPNPPVQPRIVIDPETREKLTRLRNAANRLQGEDRLADAMTAYQTYLSLQPNDSGMWSNFGVALRKAQHFEAAVACYRRALEIKPDTASYLGNLGNALKDIDQIDEALEAHRAAVELAPDDHALRYNYGIALREAALFAEALEQFDRCIENKPDEANVQWDRALALLHLGRLEEGWAAYEWRWKIGELKPPPYESPPWNGEDLQGKTILLFPEQGLGDTMLTSRFVPLVKARGATVILECKPPLWRLFEGLPGVDRLIKPGTMKSGMDFHCSLMSLPRLFEAAPDNLPSPLPLRIPDSARERAQRILRLAGERFKVGVVWSGSVTYKGNRKRSVTPERFIDFATVPGVQLYSLYKGPLDGQLKENGASALIIDVASKDKDFADTAGVIEGLDLVIMTDSAAAHLTGTLGRPIWNLLAYSPYWLYGPTGETTPWYPSMRLFRQPAPGDWDATFDAARAALETAVAAKQAGHWPPTNSA